MSRVSAWSLPETVGKLIEMRKRIEMRYLHVFLAGVFITLASASPAQGHDDAGVNALYSKLSEAVVTSDLNKVRSIYRSDSVYLGPGYSPIFGADAIASVFTKSWEAGRGKGATISLQFRLLQRIWHGSNSATDIGYSKFSFVYDDKDKAPRIFYDKFVTLAQRQKNGTWAFRIDTNNSQPAATGASEYESVKPVGNLKYDR